MISTHKVSGKVNKEGIFNYTSLETAKEFFKQNTGKHVFVTFEVYDGEVSRQYLTRYLLHILPQVQAAFKMAGENLTIDQVQTKLNYLCPLLQNYIIQNGRTTWIEREPKDLSNKEMKHLIDHIIRLFAENLNIIINE